MPIFIYDSNENATVYILSVAEKVAIKYETLEDMFLWLYKKTEAKNLRDAISLGWMCEDMSKEDIHRLKLVKKLYSACIDGVIRPRINIFCLYEDIAELASEGMIDSISKE